MSRARHLARIAIHNCGSALEDILPVLLRSKPKAAYYLHVAQLYRRMGTGALLHDDVEGGFGFLSRAARAWLHLLASVPAHRTPGSEGMPFLDALACEDRAAASGIARLTPTAPKATEDPEAFWFLRVLMDVHLRASRKRVRADLDAWEALRSPSDASALRLATVRALVEVDAVAFEAALSKQARTYGRAARREREAEMLHPDVAATTAHVSVELLALAALGRRAGLPLPKVLPMVPACALSATGPVPLPRAGAWKSPGVWRSFSLVEERGPAERRTARRRA